MKDPAENDACITSENYHLLKDFILQKIKTNTGERISLNDGISIGLGIKRKVAPNEYKLLYSEKADLEKEPETNIFIDIFGDNIEYHVFCNDSSVILVPMIHIMIWTDELQKKFNDHLCKVIAYVKMELKMK